MNEDSRYARNEDGVDAPPSSAKANEEFDNLQKKLAELRSQGILTGGHGPCKPFRPVARVPGGLARFLAERE